jgi:hypothetical protein
MEEGAPAPAHACTAAHGRPASRLARLQYEKYTKEENRDRLMNPGDQFGEAVMDFQMQIATLTEARPRAHKARTDLGVCTCCLHTRVPTRVPLLSALCAI